MRIIRVIISLLLMITVIVVTSMPILADANTENTSLDTAENAEKKLLSNGVFSYYIDNGFAVIEKCIDEASTVIVIPDRIGKFKVASINEAAFSYCLKLKGFVSQNDRFNVIDGILYSKDTLLCYPPAKSRKAFIIPPHITEISGCAFANNNSLEYISIPGTIKNVSNEAFAACSALRTVVLHEGTEKISEAAFAFCSSLQNIELPDSVNAIDDAAFYECSSLDALNISDKIEKIGTMALQNCTSLSYIYIPENVTNISDWLFSIGKNLQTVEISDRNSEYIEKDGIIYSKDGETLVFCPQNFKANSFNVPEGVKTIGSASFIENKNLETVSLSDSVTQIDSMAFYNAESLSEITVTDKLESIGDYAFFGCENLGKTVLYTTVEKLGKGAFEQCKNITLCAANGSATYFYSKQNNVAFEVDETQPEVEIEKWSQGYIDWSDSNGITSQIEDYTVTLNYEGLCWLLVNLYESVKGQIEITAENPFSDTSSPAVIKAYQLGIIDAEDSGIFDGTRNVSRQVICAYICKLVEIINKKPLENGEKNDFRDSEDIAEWAKTYVNTAYNNGIINGLPDGRINPKGNASIEDALGMLYNASLLIDR